MSVVIVTLTADRGCILQATGKRKICWIFCHKKFYDLWSYNEVSSKWSGLLKYAYCWKCFSLLLMLYYRACACNSSLVLMISFCTWVDIMARYQLRNNNNNNCVYIVIFGCLTQTKELWFSHFNGELLYWFFINQFINGNLSKVIPNIILAVWCQCKFFASCSIREPRQSFGSSEEQNWHQHLQCCEYFQSLYV